MAGMRNLGGRSESQGWAITCAIVLASVAAFGPGVATRGWAALLEQSDASMSPRFAYDVISIKPSNPSGTNSGLGFRYTADEFWVKRVTVQSLMQSAYGLLLEKQIEGAPKWVTSEIYDVDAKMESSMADKFQKLSFGERELARGQMLRALLAERFHLVVQLQSREFPLYTLVTAKKGPKLTEARPGDTYANGIAVPRGLSAGDVMSMNRDGISAQGVPMERLVGYLEMHFHCAVIDKTGLAGRYDFKLQFTNGSTARDGSLSGNPSTIPSDPVGPDLLTALDEQLGLKLVPGRGPMQVVVIDHVERPSGN